MKILSKIFFTILIVCFAIVISIVPCFASPSSSDSTFRRNQRVTGPVGIQVDLLDPLIYSSYYFPLDTVTSSLLDEYGDVGQLDAYNFGVHVVSDIDSLRIECAEDAALSVFFSPFYCSVARLENILRGIDLIYDPEFLNYSCVDSFSLNILAVDSSDNSTSYFGFSFVGSSDGSMNGVFSDVYYSGHVIETVHDKGVDAIYSLVHGFGYDYAYITSLDLKCSNYASPGPLLIDYSSVPLFNDFYNNFDFGYDSHGGTVVVEEINVVQWLYDVIDGLFTTTIFGDVSLGHLFLITLCVPMLVAVFKAIAGG